ncbi:beta-N-acetylglucosaminidase domain-containing protein [Clostridium sp. D53t1_180928_C8]|uniref:beta-N-acetylglucosaminidase domain-containing protein n=1 Tax=Clostridium sp. D53t1_180928_C8 TaxID=2787101 RepID=UPI001FAD0A48|nr:beta-N-acetylglucosaminidase domain-containing protein [Clostridium sp. D53t1_180928_C8]
MRQKRRDSKSIRRGMLATSCLVAMVVSTMLAPITNVNAKEIGKSENLGVDIYPVPQTVEYLSEGGVELNKNVNVVVHGQQEEATLRKLEEILNKNNFSYSYSNNAIEGKANLILSSEKEHCNECNSIVVADESLDKKEGYVLKISDDENKYGTITIQGADADGVYYGILTLGQILEQGAEDNRIAEVLVSDYPEIALRGFIEGFYGVPWTHEERMDLMADTSEYKMNTYIYAPKDDPYHRSNWKDLYPEEEAKQIAELAQAGKDNNFNFCWTIHPGATLTFSDEDFDALIKKYEQLYDLGVRQFGVLFDDTDDWKSGQKQAEWINRINNEFIKVKGDIAPMIVISARYNSAWGPNLSTYFTPFMQTLDKDIEVMWTGHATMSNVSRDIFNWPREKTGVDKDVAVWWNYPVNDYCRGKLLMAPMHNLSQDLDNVTGFFSNPMNQAEASKVALYSIADYTWNTDVFDYMQSWETSIEKLVPEVSEEFKRFASNVSYLKEDGGASGAFEFDESAYLAERITALNNAIENKESVTAIAEDLLGEFETIISDAKAISENVNSNLLDEIKGFLGAYEVLGEAGVAAMNTLILAEEGLEKEYKEQVKVTIEKLELMNTFLAGNGGTDAARTVVDVGTKRLKPLINKVVNTYDGMIIPQSQMTATATSENINPDNPAQDRLASHAIDGDDTTVWHTKWGSPGLPHSITINLGGTYTIDKYTYLPRQSGGYNGVITKYELQVSTDGENFTTIVEGEWDMNSALKIAKFDPVEATDIRLVAIEAEADFVSAAEINVYKADVEVVPEETFREHLKIAVELAEEITEEDLSKVVPAVANEFKEALKEAKNILTNEGFTQAEVDEAFVRLSSAMQMLEFIKGDKTQLSNLVNKIEGLNGAEYIDSTWSKLQVVFEKAKGIIADENALEAEVSESYKELLRSFLELRLKPNKDKLQDLINKAESLDSSKYTAESWNKLQKYLANAKTILENEDSTSEEIENVEKELQVALDGLVASESTGNGGNSSDENDKNDGKDENNAGSGNTGTNNSSSNNKGDLPKTGNLGGISALFMGLTTLTAGYLGIKKRK